MLGTVRLVGEVSVEQCDCHRPFSHSRSDALDRQQ